jgi:hypothetical protein
MRQTRLGYIKAECVKNEVKAKGTEEEVRITEFEVHFFAIGLLSETKTEAMEDARYRAFERYPTAEGWVNHRWNLVEIEGVVVPDDRLPYWAEE